MIIVAPEEQDGPLGEQLLAASEDYLRQRGAKLLYAGCVKPLNPFYRGLYGGSEMPGTLVSIVFVGPPFSCSGFGSNVSI